jgi:hypothetical protein
VAWRRVCRFVQSQKDWAGLPQACAGKITRTAGAPSTGLSWPTAVPAKGAATQAGQAGPVPASAPHRRAQARGELVTPADLGVVGSGVSRA